MSNDIYQTITDRIVEQLEAGTAPWVKPWSSAVPSCRPLRSTGQPYSGVNVLTLWMDAEEKGFTSPYWFGFQTAKKLGGHVRKGEKGSQVVYANKVVKTFEDENGDEQTRAIPFLKTSTVFNADQIEGLPEHFYAKGSPVEVDGHDRIAHADEFFAKAGIEIRHGGDRAFYRADLDYVQMPDLNDFNRAEDYYATLAHEATHWTRHQTRLDRDMGRKQWGDAGYAMEELVAEIGSAFLCADLALSPVVRDDHASYIASWLTVLKGDKRAIFTASSRASAAAEYLNAFSLTEDDLSEAA